MKVLMCPPTKYDVIYEINPWMDVNNKPDKKLAYEQWNALYNLYLKLNVEVELITQGDNLPDMVFTANAGIVYNGVFVSGNYRFKQRKGEEIYFQKKLKDDGLIVKTLKHFQGGEGDALLYKNTLYMGYGFRSQKSAHDEIGKILDVPTFSLKLINPYFYDFDTTFCPIGERGVLIYPEAYQKKDQEKALSIDGAICMTKQQAENFVANSIYVKGKLLVGYLDDDLKKKLKKLDIEPILLNMSEYKKAGGGIKCLTLYLKRD